MATGCHGRRDTASASEHLPLSCCRKAGGEERKARRQQSGGERHWRAFCLVKVKPAKCSGRCKNNKRIKSPGLLYLCFRLQRSCEKMVTTCSHRKVSLQLSASSEFRWWPRRQKRQKNQRHRHSTPPPLPLQGESQLTFVSLWGGLFYFILTWFVPVDRHVGPECEGSVWCREVSRVMDPFCASLVWWRLPAGKHPENCGQKLPLSLQDVW